MNSSSLTRRLFLALFVVGMVALTVVRPTFSLDAKPVATKPVATKPLDAKPDKGQSADQKPALQPLARELMADLPYAEFPDQSDKSLQALLDDSIKAHQLTDFIDKNKLSITLVDITDINAPKLAHVNGSVSFYAASLPKLAILLAVFEEVHQNNLLKF